MLPLLPALPQASSNYISKTFPWRNPRRGLFFICNALKGQQCRLWRSAMKSLTSKRTAFALSRLTKPPSAKSCRSAKATGTRNTSTGQFPHSAWCMRRSSPKRRWARACTIFTLRASPRNRKLWMRFTRLLRRCRKKTCG